MPIKCPKNFQSWQDDRHPYEIFFDQMYQAYLQEKHDNNEKDIFCFK
jgi:hypothetical protein